MIYAVRLMTRGIGQAWEHTWRATISSKTG